MSGHSHAGARPILIPALSLLAVNLSEPHFLTLDTVGWLPEPQVSLPCKPGLLPSLMVLTEPHWASSVCGRESRPIPGCYSQDSLWGQPHTTTSPSLGTHVSSIPGGIKIRHLTFPSLCLRTRHWPKEPRQDGLKYADFIMYT